MDDSHVEPGSHDALGNLRQKGSGGIGGLSELRYEHRSKPHAMTRVFDDQGLLQVEYACDAGGNVIETRRRAAGQTFQTTSITYDAFNRPGAVGSRTMGYREQIPFPAPYKWVFPEHRWHSI